VTRETKLTLSIALNPKSKLTLERGTNPTNRNTRACLSTVYTTDTHNKERCQFKLNVVSEARSGG